MILLAIFRTPYPVHIYFEMVPGKSLYFRTKTSWSGRVAALVARVARELREVQQRLRTDHNNKRYYEKGARGCLLFFTGELLC
jgi:hypothetical protein